MVDGRPVYRTLNDRYYLDLIAVTQIFAGDLVIKSLAVEPVNGLASS